MKKNNILPLILGCLLVLSSCLSDKDLPAKEKEGELSTDITKSIVDHSKWDGLLKKYVDKKGYVDYSGFQKDSLNLNKYIDYLAKTPPQENWSIEEQLAYYINLYNAGTVQLIIRHDMPGSIRDIEDNGTGPWQSEFLTIGDKKISLGAVEKAILMPMKEPRIHFAINCASESCPKLLREAYTAENVEELMERATKEFLNGPRNDIKKDTARISSIFQFYPADFKVRHPSVKAYINQYTEAELDENTVLMYIKYDWSLNNQKNPPN